MICVIDYGMGNLRSVSKAIQSLAPGESVCVSDRPRILARADKLVLPGVGEFGQAMRELKERRLVDSILKSIRNGKPFLGICLGLQILFNKSEESPRVRGLGILHGSVKRLPRKRKSALKIPHMGWNQVVKTAESALTRNVPDKSFFYFVHSYYAEPEEDALVAGVTDYGVRFASVIGKGNLYAVQFHPEKSQALGLRILQNYLRIPR